MLDSLRNLTFKECRETFIDNVKASDTVRLTVILRSDKDSMDTYRDGDEVVLVYDRLSQKPFIIIERIALDNPNVVDDCRYFLSAVEENEYVINFEVYEPKGVADIMFIKRETYELLSSS